ncbi:YehR family lipoprotein [Klebsiella sp. RHBSTW-00484]|uniref:YehR family lipoprotein n=1 Tax=unclassified Klebsiella TaxID=2608929 RepID=UPI0015E563D0|nr:MULTISPECIES: YehR family lipoprotein [unclassified Klebsiella]QLO36179.1 YehR family lipoprotein [Klebsiella sp. RHBSTW-00484]QLT75696.1 YehR family lipoprotein [Klebsiella sp. RHBSTW-00464]
MQFNRKIVTILSATVLLAALVGCDNKKDEVKAFSNTMNGVELTFTYHYKGDIVTRQDADNTIPYKSLGVTNEEQARKIIDPIGAAYGSIKGVTHKVDYKESYAQEHLSIDFNQVKISDLCKLPGASFTDCEQKFISLSESEKMLTSQGFKEVK